MKKFIGFLFLLSMALPGLADKEEFTYDKVALSKEFGELNRISDLVETTDQTFNQISTDPEFKGVTLTNEISLKPNLTFDQVDWGSFAWGFCCWPIGIFTVLINDEKDKTSKDSYWAGLGTAALTFSVAYIAVYGFFIASFGGF